MTSRSSSWVNLVENNKRRIWQWALTILLLVVLNSVLLLLMLMSIDETDYIMNYGTRAAEMMKADAARMCAALMGVGAYRIIVTTILAVLSAWGGFSYINDKVKLDFYESIPVKRGNRFSTIWINGVIMYAGTYIIGTLLCFAIATVTGYGAVYSMEEAFYALVKMLLYFLGVYHLYILAMMLTGTSVAGVCAFLFLALYEFSTRGLVGLLKMTFFKYDYILDGFYIPVLSPFGQFIKMSDRTYLLMGGSEVKMQACMLVFDFALLVLSYVLYLRRPAEKAGKTLAFKVIAPVLKFLIGTEVVAYAAVLTVSILNRTKDLKMSDFGVIVLVCLITSIIICAIVEAIFELDIKAALGRKAAWFICAVCGLVFFFSFKVDFLNIDEYVPADNRVASVVFAPEGYDETYNYYDSELGSVSDYEYWLKHMKLYDTESVRKLSMLSMRKFDEALKVVGSEDEIYKYGDGNEFSTAVVMYRMKSGRLITRKLYVPIHDSEAIALLDRIMSTGEFVNGYFDEMALDVDNDISVSTGPYKGNNEFSDGIQTIKLTSEDVKELIRLYRTDMERYSFEKRRDLWPAGFVDYEVVSKDSRGYERYSGGISMQTITIFPDMTGCIGFLKDKGYDRDERNYAKNIRKIDITDYHYDEQEKDAKEQGLEYLPEDMAQSYIRNKSYVKDSREFSELAAALVPNERGFYRWDGGLDGVFKYDIFVTFEPSSSLNGEFRNGAQFCLLKGNIPDFVEKDLAL